MFYSQVTQKGKGSAGKGLWGKLPSCPDSATKTEREGLSQPIVITEMVGLLSWYPGGHYLGVLLNGNVQGCSLVEMDVCMEGLPVVTLLWYFVFNVLFVGGGARIYAFQGTATNSMQDRRYAALKGTLWGRGSRKRSFILCCE